MAAPPIRSIATIGGNIVSAVPCADLPPILMTMKAEVVVWSPKGERRTPLESFFTGVRATVLQPGELVTAVFIPTPAPGSGSAYERFALRNGNAIAVAGVAATVTLDRGETVKDARVALAAVSPIPKLVEGAHDALVGKPIDEATLDAAAKAAVAAAQPITDVRGTAEYRRDIVAVLARRAIMAAAQRAKETRS